MDMVNVPKPRPQEILDHLKVEATERIYHEKS